MKNDDLEEEVFTRASEIIKELKLLIEKHGDLKVQLGVTEFVEDDDRFHTTKGTVICYRSYEYIVLSAYA